MSTFAILMASMGSASMRRPAAFLATPRTINTVDLGVFFPATVTSGIVIKADGTIAKWGGGSINDVITPPFSGSEWYPGVTGSLWEVRCTQQSGEVLDDQTALNSWFSLSVDRTYGWTVVYPSSPASTTSECTIEFRLAATPAEVYSFPNITISASI